MSEVKARLVGAITVMDEAMSGWDNMEEVDPDEFDLQMIRDVESDPDCRIISQ